MFSSLFREKALGVCLRKGSGTNEKEVRPLRDRPPRLSVAAMWPLSLRYDRFMTWVNP